VNTAAASRYAAKRIELRRLTLALVVGLLPLGCADDSSEPDPINEEHKQICLQIDATVGLHDGLDVPGGAGAPRWGIPQAFPFTRRIRRSWSTLSDSEKTQVIDAFIALKSITVDSGNPGSTRANYNSFCDELGLQTYDRNLYDYYVEAHANAWVSMMTRFEGHTQMAHMGPQFLPWHRYVLLRIEADMGEAVGDPHFALPYWDWTDCEDEPGTCGRIFERDSLGSAGSCDPNNNSVEGYLTDQGFRTNVLGNGESIFSLESIVCDQRPVTRAVGCSEFSASPAGSTAIDGIFDRMVYDAAPYNSCDTEEDVSFRQYLEGFSNDELRPVCVITGCSAMHGQGHEYIGGDMNGGSPSPNDPIFFLHHAQVDRLWAAWQQANLAAGDAQDYGNPGFPRDFLGPLFNFDEVGAWELFDYKALGYEYDTLPQK
jgi:tyrosinase